MALNIHCTVIEVPAVSDNFQMNPEPRFENPVVQDLVPWADPYIVSLIEKVERQGGRLFDNDYGATDEASPPLDVEEMRPDRSFGDDWSQR